MCTSWYCFGNYEAMTLNGLGNAEYLCARRNNIDLETYLAIMNSLDKTGKELLKSLPYC